MYKSLTCSTRLSEAQTKKLDILASQNNLNRSLYIKKILIDHIDNYYENTNILSKNVFQNNQKIDELKNSVNLLTQFFYNWLANWFASHPKINNNNKIAEDGIDRRNKFTEYFLEELFEENENLFSLLTAQLNEQG